MSDYKFLSRLARKGDSKIVLLILDGLGDLKTAEQPQTALEAASTPNLDALAARSSLGRIDPVMTGVTPGSGPAHLALFGYDPREPEADIGRGVLEALGLGLEIAPTEIAARGNFATADAEGRITDRRAGRIPSEEGHRVCAKMRDALTGWDGPPVRIEPGEAYRFVLLLDGQDLSAELTDTDPQSLGVEPLTAKARTPAAEATADVVNRLIQHLGAVIADEPKANRTLLRGFSRLPNLPAFPDLYRLRAGAFAGYPLYRGVASACGMKVVPASKDFFELLGTVAENWNDFDYFFLHVKQTDQAGEDGNLPAKIEVIEKVDQALPGLLDLQPDALCITGDHSTPAPMRAHSWHPVPLLLHSPAHNFLDEEDRFDETACTRGHLGTFPSRELMGLLLAHARRLAKFGA